MKTIPEKIRNDAIPCGTHQGDMYLSDTINSLIDVLTEQQKEIEQLKQYRNCHIDWHRDNNLKPYTAMRSTGEVKYCPKCELAMIGECPYHNPIKPQEEIWKDVVGFEGYYKVSSKGKVYSILGSKMRKPFINKLRGYYMLNLYKDGKYTTFGVHKLVGNAFLNATGSDLDLNHIDGNKLNNNLENLELVTRSENVQHAIRLGLRGKKRSQ